MRSGQPGKLPFRPCVRTGKLPSRTSGEMANCQFAYCHYDLGWSPFGSTATVRRFAEHEKVDNLPRLRLPLSRWMSVAIMDTSATKGETRPRIQ